MSRSRTTAGKRNVQQKKREKARAKQERRAARREGDLDPTEPVEASEAQLVDELAALHAALEAGEVSIYDFEERREHIGNQLEQIQRLER